ncbi:MarR family winged helix-turn-helix transcriptional regulator [Limosilactobacillus caecicola]|uniref:MarR family winged helix-turn-helix transcriptional regulator n=1 Tax=Limosilactobacillus caecicola TaxID=2941332 RepID=UPI0020408417|nr:MarR family winged helix-turn-helix transcriptional regulator [Limosilactobacillus caecicola]
MQNFTTQLFLDVKKFEKYQEMLKKSVHLAQAQSDDYQLAGFPNSRVYRRIIGILADHSEGMTNSELIFEHDFRPSEFNDGVKALVDNDLATTKQIDEHHFHIELTEKGRKWAEGLDNRRDKIADAAYGSLNEDDQRELDRIVNKLIDDYKGRDVNYTALSELI